MMDHTELTHTTASTKKRFMHACMGTNISSCTHANTIYTCSNHISPQHHVCCLYQIQQRPRVLLLLAIFVRHSQMTEAALTRVLTKKFDELSMNITARTDVFCLQGTQ